MYGNIKASETQATKPLEEKLQQLVENLADPHEWNWTRLTTRRDAADDMLREMAELGIIQHQRHPLGGDVWLVGDKIFGRVDELLSKEK